MISMRAKKRLKLNISGRPSNEIEPLEKPSHVALVPEKIPFVKPRLKVKTGDRVKVGSVVFEDKSNPDLKFLSPGAGEITNIDFGPRRVIREIAIRLDEDEAYEEFEAIPDDMKRDELVAAMMKGGVWPFIRALPFRNIADPEEEPPGIIVSLDGTEPFQPRPEVYLRGETDLFEYGIQVLKRLTENVIVTAADSKFSRKRLKAAATHLHSGGWPAGDPGVRLYNIKKSAAENRMWYVDGQDLLNIARFCKYGFYPIGRIMVVAGSAANRRKHVRTRAGVPLGYMAGENGNGSRFVAGGFFTGCTASKDACMGFYENSLIIAPEGDQPEAFGFVRPGYSKPSASRTFLSVFNDSEMAPDCALHGEERACVNCGYCHRICPADILPQFTLKCVLADEIEEALAHGLLDCAECGLCSYVCPSKIELCETFKNAKREYHKEMA